MALPLYSNGGGGGWEPINAVNIDAVRHLCLPSPCCLCLCPCCHAALPLPCCCFLSPLSCQALITNFGVVVTSSSKGIFVAVPPLSPFVCQVGCCVLGPVIANRHGNHASSPYPPPPFAAVAITRMKDGAWCPHSPLLPLKSAPCHCNLLLPPSNAIFDAVALPLPCRRPLPWLSNTVRHHCHHRMSPPTGDSIGCGRQLQAVTEGGI
jgi:hypothetical protein